MKATDFLMSSYSGNISSSIRRIVFLCQGALSITKAYLLPSGTGCAVRKERMESMVVSQLNFSGFVVNNTPFSGIINPLYDVLKRPGKDFTVGALPFLYHPEVTVV